MRILFLTCFFLLLTTGCGRKQKDIFYFPEKAPVPKMSSLSFPAVKGVRGEKTLQGNKISWSPSQIEEIEIKKNAKLLGYNVYRLVCCYFVPKKPLNNDPILDTLFFDNQILEEECLRKQKQHCYLVRAVFKFYDQVKLGPASQVVCVT